MKEEWQNCDNCWSEVMIHEGLSFSSPYCSECLKNFKIKCFWKWKQRFICLYSSKIPLENNVIIHTLFQLSLFIRKVPVCPTAQGNVFSFRAASIQDLLPQFWCPISYSFVCYLAFTSLPNSLNWPFSLSGLILGLSLDIGSSYTLTSTIWGRSWKIPFNLKGYQVSRRPSSLFFLGWWRLPHWFLWHIHFLVLVCKNQYHLHFIIGEMRNIAKK